ncbi:adenylate kinase [Hypoxylon fragiforme]|uniref:adenylate kinase n=1 Tax=Hypoxylon fragiforme TaxID=63214 RepID=UPI0020C65F38|nr:adenylate kinase [Hypoxylon fragiforme]KAI2603853.1 adenylate kinase [Hypoxylon fragiforme]
MRLRRAARVILVGAPGVGKGTQSERLLTRFPQLSAISSGDLLRHNVKNRTPLGIKVEKTMKTGGLVSDDLILRLITNELGRRGWLYGGRPNVMTLSSSSASIDGSGASLEDTASAFGSGLEADPLAGACLSAQASNDPAASFLLDGFPRTATQAERLDRIVPINWAVSIQTPFDVIMQRIASRWVHEPSGRVYNTTFNTPKVAGYDDITGEPLVQRVDDTEEVYRARFQKFQETSEPLLEHYAKKGVLWEVHGMSSNEISPKLYQEFERRFL